MPNVPPVLVTLGKARELHLDDGDVVKWKYGQYLLYSSVTGKQLYVIKKGKKNKVKLNFDDELISRGVNLYGNFQDFDPGHGIHITTGGLENGSKIGRAAAILYNSDKWGDKNVLYIHNFADSPIAWFNGRTNACALTGGKILVTERGIEG